MFLDLYTDEELLNRNRWVKDKNIPYDTEIDSNTIEIIRKAQVSLLVSFIYHNVAHLERANIPGRNTNLINVYRIGFSKRLPDNTTGDDNSCWKLSMSIGENEKI